MGRYAKDGKARVKRHISISAEAWDNLQTAADHISDLMGATVTRCDIINRLGSIGNLSRAISPLFKDEIKERRLDRYAEKIDEVVKHGTNGKGHKRPVSREDSGDARRRREHRG